MLKKQLKNKCSKNEVKTGTVVISCYNQQDYIKECLTSILEQKVDFYFDIVISDDNSTDSTVKIIEDIIDSSPIKITLNVNNNNLGANGNYLKVHSLATGDIVFHFDGDDIMLPGKLQNQFDLFKSEDDVNIIFHRARYFNDDRSYSSETGFIDDNYHAKYKLLTLNDLASSGTIAVHSSYAFRRAARSKMILERPFMEWFWAMDAIRDSGQVGYINKILVEYRCNQDGVAYSRTRKGRIKAYDIYFTDLIYYFYSLDLKKELYSNAFVSVLGMIKYNKYFNCKYLFFLLRNLKYFSVSKILKTAKIRRLISPSVRSD